MVAWSSSAQRVFRAPSAREPPKFTSRGLHSGDAKPRSGWNLYSGLKRSYFRHGLRPGSKPNPYEIVPATGKIGMGEAWKTRDLRLGRDVAIKISAQYSFTV
jgi:hypothetical protein